ncbi:MAG: PDZ domain-containing protein [Oceanospirillales bacterium TMED33]|nr:transcriptional regulator [Gammaproteobacteria bacterium]RPG20093.1 MAG: PDZ domain-containing protein [Oceanospirillales bacterium TMED33]CAI8303451.1 MAG: Periplasmic pH-dependent serine endoprotease DegQ [Gammaproteobacteria bacterium]|tara:strand:- start:48 stop:1199 length:1152 start_codon:yes stop_codon:yes gene_type:complete
MLQQITRILWPIIAGILIALLVIREFPELTGRTRGVELNIVDNSPIADQIPLEGPSSYATAVERAAPAVVNVYTTTIVETRAHPMARDPFFRNFFNLPSEPRRKRMESSLGSGVIVSANGYILTNHHVIAGADDIVVELKDGRVSQASVVGTDLDTDIAVLKIELNNLPKLILTTSPGRVGDLVFAIGNPFGVGQTVTMGILSATGRNQVGLANYEDFIQTDAAINPGNSGGALINVRGELVGINTAIFTRSGGSNGIGFAIPASIATDIMQELLDHGQVIRGWIGVETKLLTEDLARSFGVKKNTGVLISGVYRRGPAANADILPGDILTHMNDQKITDGRAAMNQVAGFDPGAKIVVRLLRNGQPIERIVLVGQRPHSATN